MVDKLGSDWLGNVDSFVAGEEIVHQSGFEFLKFLQELCLFDNASLLRVDPVGNSSLLFNAGYKKFVCTKFIPIDFWKSASHRDNGGIP